MLAFGFFNLYWAFQVYRDQSAGPRLGLVPLMIALVFLLAELICGFVILVFGLFILTFKSFWAYSHFYKVKRAFEAKIVLD